MGIGKGTAKLSDLKTSYKQASDALAYKFYMGYNQIIHCNDVKYYESSSILDIDKIGNEIVIAVELCDRDRLEAGLYKLFEDIRLNSCSDMYIRNICINLISKVSVKLLDMNESFSEVFGQETLVWKRF